MTTYTFPNTNIGNTGNFDNTDNTFAKAGLLLDSSQQNGIVMDMPIPLPDPMYWNYNVLLHYPWCGMDWTAAGHQMMAPRHLSDLDMAAQAHHHQHSHHRSIITLDQADCW